MAWLSQSELHDWSANLNAGLQRWKSRWLSDYSGEINVTAVFDASSCKDAVLGVQFSVSTKLQGVVRDAHCWVSNEGLHTLAMKLLGPVSGDAGAFPEIYSCVALDALCDLFLDQRVDDQKPSRNVRCFNSPDVLVVKFNIGETTVEVLSSFGKSVLPSAIQRGGKTVGSHLTEDEIVSLCGQKDVRFEVALGHAIIDLGALAELAVGDVICLESGLTAPLQITSGKATLGSAFLGSFLGKKAVQLI